jgi:hypothetical protein
MPPKIAIIHVNSVPSETFEEFRQVTASREVDVQVLAVDPPGPTAGIEWLMPAFVTGFVASAYFGGFFQEMGKDHYVLLKEQFKKLYPKVAGPEAPDVKLVGTKGKVNEVQPYSLYFSLVGEGPNGLRVKLLLKKQIASAEYDRCVEIFLDLLRDLNTGTLSDAARRRFESVTPMSRTMLVVYDDTIDEVVPIDPRTGELRR